jgi:hypothetical protein
MGDSRPPATFQALCVDAVDAHRLGTFWAGLLGIPLEDVGDGDTAAWLEDRRLWFNTVPEPMSAKHRVHMDVRLTPDATNSLPQRGARLLRDRDPRQHWQVWSDPDGGEFCVMQENVNPDNGRRTGLFEVIVDSADPRAAATWWHSALGGQLMSKESASLWWLEHVPGMPFDYLDFVPVPEPKVVKNRVHWDVAGDTEALLGLGARLLRAADDEIHWDVLADPEGNEFCVFTPT